MATMSETIPDLTRERALSLYRGMVVIRRTEEALARAHAGGLVHGACHTYVGEEAVATGVCAHLRTDDTVLSTHRGHGHALAKGVPPREVMAELFGRATGCSRGRGGSMHLFAPEVGLLGTSGIVGPSILHGDRRGLQLPPARDRPRQRRLLRRRRRQQRRVPRGAQPGRDLAPAGPVRLREQPLRDRGALRDGDAQSGRRGPRRGLRPAGRRGRRQRRPRRLRGRRRGGAAGAARRRADAARVPHLPHPRPLRGDARRRLPHARGGRRVAGARPDRALARPAARGGPAPRARTSTASTGGGGAGGGGGRVRRGEPVAGPRERDPATCTREPGEAR